MQANEVDQSPREVTFLSGRNREPEENSKLGKKIRINRRKCITINFHQDTKKEKIIREILETKNTKGI